MIKRPTGTREWATRNENCFRGCQHGCYYCYARSTSVIRYKTDTNDWTDMRPSKKAGRKSPFRLSKKERIMFPTTHDIVPEHVDLCIKFMRFMLEDPQEHDLLIVSKPHFRVIDKICKELEEYKSRIMFRFTIGSADDTVLSMWEPNAPGYRERILSVHATYANQWMTSISCEPMLDDNIYKVVADIEDCVNDAIWLGKMNKIDMRLRANGAPQKVIDAANQLKVIQSDENMLALYNYYKDHPKIKWKDSIKQIVGLETPDEIGLDI